MATHTKKPTSSKVTLEPPERTLLDGAGLVSLILVGANLIPPYSSVSPERLLLLVVSGILLEAMSRRRTECALGSGWQPLGWVTGFPGLGAGWLLSLHLILKALLDQSFRGVHPRQSLREMGRALPVLAAVSLIHFLSLPAGMGISIAGFVALTFLLHSSVPRAQIFRQGIQELFWFGFLLWASSLGIWPLTGGLVVLLAAHVTEEANDGELRESLSRQMQSTEGTLRASQQKFREDERLFRNLLTVQGVLDDFQGRALPAETEAQLATVLVSTLRGLDEGCRAGVCRLSTIGNGPVSVLDSSPGFSVAEFTPFPEGWKPGQMLRSPCGARFFYALSEEVIVMLCSDLSRAKLKQRHEEFLEHLLARARLIVRILNQKRELAELVDEKSTALTQLAASQDQLVQSRKLASIGQLAAGVAHEINSPLAAIHLQAQMARRRLAKNDVEGVLRSLETCQHAGLRAKSIIDSLLTYSQYSDGVRESQVLGDIVSHNVRMLEAHFEDSEISLTVEPQEAHPPIQVNAQEIGQVLTNILLNAVDALKERVSDRRIVIAFSSTPSEQRVVLSNNGPPLADDTRERLFDPFFTTKEVGSGTGLGLSIAYQLAHGHGGTLLAENRQGWVQFSLVLPYSA